MTLRDYLGEGLVRIHPEESVAVAARLLAAEDLGCLPVCGEDGRLRGLVTDRDLVVRCLAAGKVPSATKVEEVMTVGLITGEPDMEAAGAAALMAGHGIRRLPVLENGRLRGIVSLERLK